MIPEVIESKLVYVLDEDTTVWKKAIIYDENGPYGFNMAIVKLTIPKFAEVVISTEKCRASYAKVEGIYPMESCEPKEPLDVKIAHSWFKFPTTFSYEVGKAVWPDLFDPDPHITCSHGIHFFRTYEEAAVYEFD